MTSSIMRGLSAFCRACALHIFAWSSHLLGSNWCWSLWLSTARATHIESCTKGAQPIPLSCPYWTLRNLQERPSCHPQGWRCAQCCRCGSHATLIWYNIVSIDLIWLVSSLVLPFLWPYRLSGRSRSLCSLETYSLSRVLSMTFQGIQWSRHHLLGTILQ